MFKNLTWPPSLWSRGWHVFFSARGHVFDDSSVRYSAVNYQNRLANLESTLVMKKLFFFSKQNFFIRFGSKNKKTKHPNISERASRYNY